MADQGTEGLLSRYLRKKRIDAVLPYMNGSVLDYGCGSGALCEHISADRYMGFDYDGGVLKIAREKYPVHRFTHKLLSPDARFDTIVSLAVIEHVPDPEDFLCTLSCHMTNTTQSRIIITTPHPSFERPYILGAKLGLFSKHANMEHKELFNRRTLYIIGQRAGLRCVIYQRLLFGANQIAVFSKVDK